MKKFLILYIPVIHQGYLNLFERHKEDVECLYLLGEELLSEFMTLHKEIRAVSPETNLRLLGSMKIFPDVRILKKEGLKELGGREMIFGNDEISKGLAKKYFPNEKVIFEDVFLRWDEGNVKSGNFPKYSQKSSDSFDREMAALAKNEADKSSDWWRHVGAVLVKNGKIILESHNQHLPSENTPYIEGDPRDFIEAGKLGFLSTAIHAEQAIIAEAAQKGISTEGASMYLNVFPCLVCARIMAFAGIKKCYFSTGNAYLNVEDALRSKGVEIILVE